VIGDGLGAVEAEAAPAFALGGFESLKEMEEGDWGGGVGWWEAGRKGGDDAGYGPGFGAFDFGAGEDVGGLAAVGGRLVCHLGVSCEWRDMVCLRPSSFEIVTGQTLGELGCGVCLVKRMKV